MVEHDDSEWLPEIPDGLESLTPNSGGVVDPADLVGREQELTRLHEAVIAGGAHVTGERRMGKTSLVKKLQDDLVDTVTAIYVSAETESLELFAHRLLGRLRQNRLVSQRISQWEKEVGGDLNLTFAGLIKLSVSAKGTKPAGLKSEMPTEIDVLDLLAFQNSDPVVLIIDEITYLCKHLGQKAAQEFMSELRSRRQSGGPPMVISGSIGLHHELDDLHSVADLWTVEVGPLSQDEAVVLAARLFLGIGVEPTPGLVAELITQTSAIPFYMHAVADKLRYRDDLDIDDVVNDCLDKNDWKTIEYETRLEEYYNYGADGAKQAKTVLDLVAVADGAVSVDAITARLAIENPDLAPTRDDLLVLLRKLEMDHYLSREENGERMSSPLLARIWCHLRRL